MKAKTGKPVDYIVFISVFILLSFGIIIVFSASWPYAHNEYNDVYYILKRQLLFALIGFVAMFLAANYDYRKLEKFAPYLMALSLALLILVLIPGIGRPTNDVWRWLYIGPFQLQPSEVAKAAVILFFAHSLSKRRDDLKYFFKGFVPYLVLIGIISVLLLKEPHLSCTIIIILLASVMLFCAGARVFHFMIVWCRLLRDCRSLWQRCRICRRSQAFIDPWKDMAGDGWQVVQSLYAIGSGGLFGRGLGKSMQKFMYLPEPHNDFIFPILAEELGFIGVFTVLFMFGVFIWRGIRIAVNAPDMFGNLLAIGITSLIAIQSLLNVATVTASVPPTGVSLPFFSSGGTSLIMFMTEVGVLMNISRYSQHHRRI